MATTMQPATSETTKQLVNYRTDGGVAVIEMCDPPANTYTYEMNRQLDEAILQRAHGQRCLRHFADRRGRQVLLRGREYQDAYRASIRPSNITSACTPTRCCCAWSTRRSW